MIKANFKVVATILALHVPKEIAQQHLLLEELNTSDDFHFDDLLSLVKANVITIMHDAYESITVDDTALHLPIIFSQCFDTFIEHEEFMNIPDFLLSVLNKPEKAQAFLKENGITVTYEEDGIKIETGGQPIMPAPDMMQ